MPRPWLLTKAPPSTQLGDPLSKLMVPSNGVGVGGGIGSGSGGGVGSGHGGPGVGPGIFHVGDGVSAPRAIYTPEPEFSEEARKAKYQGVVVVTIIVGTDGHVHNPRVVRSLGMGLDEKAIEGVKTWKFDPSKKDGRAVAVEMNVEVAFNLVLKRNFRNEKRRCDLHLLLFLVRTGLELLVFDFFQLAIFQLLLALNAIARPGHSFQPFGIDFISATHAFAKCAFADTLERSFHHRQELALIVAL